MFGYILLTPTHTICTGAVDNALLFPIGIQSPHDNLVNGEERKRKKKGQMVAQTMRISFSLFCVIIGSYETAHLPGGQAGRRVERRGGEGRGGRGVSW